MMIKTRTPTQKLTVAAASAAALLLGGVVLVRDVLGQLIRPEGSASKTRQSGDLNREPLVSPSTPFRPVTALSLRRKGSRGARHSTSDH